MLDADSPGLAWVLDYLRALRAGRLRPYSFCERKARAATRDAPWGPTGPQLRELAAASYAPDNLPPLFDVLCARLRAKEHKWRKAYKALVVLEWLATRGSPAAAQRAQGLRFLLEELRSFSYVDPDTGVDHGVNVRHRAAAVLALLADTEHLGELRDAQAKQYWAVSSADAPPPRPTYGDLGRRPARGGGGGGGSDSDEGDAAATPPPPPRHAPAAAVHVGPRAHGDSKGLTPEAAERCRVALAALGRAPHNRTCADCAAPPATWASISCGVFLCQRCAGVHRGLGVHVSTVRSITLDAWHPEQVAFMAATGNAVANAHWEAVLPPGFVRPSSEQVEGKVPLELEGFIRRKYTRAYVRPGSRWPPPGAAQQGGPGGQAAVAAAAAVAAPAAQQQPQPQPQLLRVELRPPPTGALRKPLPALPSPTRGPLETPPPPPPRVSATADVAALFFDVPFGDTPPSHQPQQQQQQQQQPALALPPPLPPLSFFGPPPPLHAAAPPPPPSSAAPVSFFGAPRAVPASLAAMSVSVAFPPAHAQAGFASAQSAAAAAAEEADLLGGLTLGTAAAPAAAPRVQSVQSVRPAQFDLLRTPPPAAAPPAPASVNLWGHSATDSGLFRPAVPPPPRPLQLEDLLSVPHPPAQQQQQLQQHAAAAAADPFAAVEPLSVVGRTGNGSVAAPPPPPTMTMIHPHLQHQQHLAAMSSGVVQLRSPAPASSAAAASATPQRVLLGAQGTPSRRADPFADLASLR